MSWKTIAAVSFAAGVLAFVSSQGVTQEAAIIPPRVAVDGHAVLVASIRAPECQHCRNKRWSEDEGITGHGFSYWGTEEDMEEEVSTATTLSSFGLTAYQHGHGQPRFTFASSVTSSLHADDDEEVFEESGSGFWLNGPASVRKCKDYSGGGPGCHGSVNVMTCNTYHESISLLNCDYVGSEQEAQHEPQTRIDAVLAAVSEPNAANIDRLVSIVDDRVRYNSRRAALQVLGCDDMVIAHIPVSETLLRQSSWLAAIVAAE